MASKTITVTLLTRSDTESNFQTTNPVLSAGEMAISTDKGNMFKVGDGVNTWSDLSYNSISWDAITNRPNPSSASPNNVGVAASAGTATNYSREDHTHAITVTTGDNNGQVKIAGQNATVKGIQNSAYKNTFEGTEEQWNQLSTEQKKAYDEYKITDDYVEPTNPDADDINYDNTTSGMVANNVQSAIDEVNSLVAALGLSVVNGEVVQTVIEEV